MPMNIVCWGYNQWKSCCLWINFSWCLISQANSWRQPNKEIRWIIQDEDFYTVFSGVMCADNHSFWGYLHAQPKVCTLQWVEWNFLTFLLSLCVWQQKKITFSLAFWLKLKIPFQDFYYEDVNFVQCSPFVS